MGGVDKRGQKGMRLYMQSPRPLDTHGQKTYARSRQKKDGKTDTEIKGQLGQIFHSFRLTRAMKSGNKQY